MDCSQAREHLSAFDVNAPPIKEIVDHLAGCTDCRAEQVQFQQLQEAMGDLAETIIEPPVWLLASLTETTIERLRRNATRAQTSKQLASPRVATGGALLLAGIAGALVFRRRSRRLRIGGLAAA